MTTDTGRWRRLKALFEEALAQPPEERAAWIARAAGSDTALRTELDQLVAADTDQGVIDKAIADAACRLLDENPEPVEAALTGRRFGPYRIVRELGRGGMGRVFLAERDDSQYLGRVAIKLIAADTAASTSLHDRFRTERQVQADLQHPGIARLLDAGATEDGEAYLVMEYVDGERIDAYCARKRLSVRERLRLLVTLCDIVQYAHSNLVVHRDIKPSNVLVTGEGELKLLDFGIAKLIDPERAASLALHQTTDVSRVLTLDSASPEQLRGQPATTATDVYALGALLYRLLTGHAPFSPRGTDPVTLAKAILGRELPRPSLAVLEPDGPAPDALSPASFAAQLRSTPDKHSRALRGDLDTIILKALHKAPERRYVSAAELAADIDRHLQQQPVLARGDSAGYVLRRFLVRQRRAVASVATGLLVMIALAGFYTAELAAERDRAQREARRAEEVSSFLTGLFESATPEETLGEWVSARDVLDLGATRIDQDLAGEPAVQAALMHVIGSAYAALGFVEPATELLERALAIREALGGPPDALLGDVLNALGNLRATSGRFEEAAALLDQALATRLAVRGGAHREIVETYLVQAFLHTYRLEFDAAGERVDAADAVLARMDSPEPETVASVLVWRGNLAQRRGRFDEAIGHFEAALALRTATVGFDHPSNFNLRSALIQVLANAGRSQASETMGRELLDARRRVLPGGHPAIAVTLSDLATALKEQGRPAEAEPYQAEALAIRRAAHGGDHPEIVIALNNLANLRHDMRDLEGAYVLHQEALAMNQAIYGEDHSILANNYTNLAALAMDREEWEEAIVLYRRTLALDRAAFGNEHPFISHTMGGLSNALIGLGRLAEAEAMLREALLLSVSAPGPDHPQTAQLQRDLGIALGQQRRCGEAEPLLRTALEGFERVSDTNRWQVALTRTYLGGCLIALGSPEAGEPLLQAGYASLIEARGPHHAMTRQVRDLWPEHRLTTE